MKTLCMDTAHKYLSLALVEDGRICAQSVSSCWKKQSEAIFPQLIAMMEEANWQVDDLDQVVITEGPGSYTGVRIAMTIAKVLCTRKKIDLYTVSTLALYAGMDENVFVMMDARSKRAYCAAYNQGIMILPECIMTLDEIKEYLSAHDYQIYGDGSLIGKEDYHPDFAKQFASLIPFAKKIENIHTLTPSYLKDSDAYMVKK